MVGLQPETVFYVVAASGLLVALSNWPIRWRRGLVLFRIAIINAMAGMLALVGIMLQRPDGPETVDAPIVIAWSYFGLSLAAAIIIQLVLWMRAAPRPKVEPQ